MIWNLTTWGLCLLLFMSGRVLSQTEATENGSGSVQYYYRFDSPMLETVRAELKFDDSSRASLTLRRKSDEEDIQLDVQLLPETIKQVKAYLVAARFLETNEEYQGDRDLSHLGTITFRCREGSRGRQVQFNYTRNRAMRELAELLRHIVTQETRIFNIQIARQYEPLALDRQLQALTREVKNGWVAEPAKLRPLLEDLQADEGVLLIARRRAGDILKLIKGR